MKRNTDRYPSNDPEAGRMASIDSANEREQEPQTLITAVCSNKERCTTFCPLIVPFIIVMIFIAICLGDEDGYYDWTSMVEVSVFNKVVLILHGMYLTPLWILYELAKKIDSGSSYAKRDKYKRKIPRQPDNLYWMMTCLSGELCFVIAILYFLMAAQEYLFRWTLILPIAQCAYNMKNDCLWLMLGKTWSFWVLVDTIFIGLCSIIYVFIFFLA